MQKEKFIILFYGLIQKNASMLNRKILTKSYFFCGIKLSIWLR
jgi:hypothetical protein